MEIRMKKGETLSLYSHLFAIPEKLLLDANPEFAANELSITGNIRIPGYRKITYTAMKGDSVETIAARSGFSKELLFFLNGEKSIGSFEEGEALFLPLKADASNNRRRTYYDTKQLMQDLYTFKQWYPFLRFNVVGNSVLGKPIHEIRLGTGPRKIQINASFHANEWITSLILMDLIEFYLISLIKGEKLGGTPALTFYEQVELSIVPMVNPDGVDLVLHGPKPSQMKKLIEINDGNEEFTHWKANIRGIDLNNQFPANWEIEKLRKLPKSPAARDYPGEAPLTEPEAIALANLAHQTPFSCLVALHTQGKEFYWGYEGLEPAYSEELAKEFERSSGYKAVRNIDSHAGYKDWFIQEFRRPGFTIELGKGINPLPLSMVDEILLEARALFISLLTFHSN